MKSKGLGKGLEALITPTLPTDTLPVGESGVLSGERVLEIPLDKIDTYVGQPRTSFDDEALQELSESIKQHGVLQPIIVSANGDRYSIVAGERRFRAAMLNKMESIPAIVREYDAQKTLEVALIENLQRENLNPIEEARALRELKEKYGLTHEQLSQTIGKNRATIANSIRLLNLPQEVISEVETGHISAGHARALLPLENSDKIKAFASEIIENKLSVREVESRVNEMLEESERQFDEESKPKRARGKRNCAFPEAEKDLSEKLELKVRISGTKNKGRLVINYSSEEEIQKLFDLLNR